MKKILFLTRSLNYGGAEHQLVLLAKGLRVRSHDVKVAVFYSNGPLETDLVKAGVQVFQLEKKGRWDVIGFLWRLSKLLRNEKPTILHGYLPVPNLLTILVKPFFPSTRMIWGVRASHMDLSRYDWLSRLTFMASCFFSRFADLIILNSKSGQDFHCKQGYPRSKMVVISNGIDTERFRPDSNARARIRQEWEIRDDEKLIGLVGRLDPMKDHPTFLKAAALLEKECSNVRFVCVGEGPDPYQSELHALGERLGLGKVLIWAGKRSDMSAVYNAFDVLTSSSYGEGFPNVIGEAMACGVTCVVTDVGDSALIVGNAGVVVCAQSPKSLTEGLKIALTQRHKLSNSRQDIIDHFSVIKLLDNTEEKLTNLDDGRLL